MRQGVSEFIFGLQEERLDEMLRFWAILGFSPVTEGALDEDAAGALYGHRSALRGIRLKHAGCDTFGTGYVRLQVWRHLANEGLGNSRPLNTGSRWMGMYTQDILQVRDAFTAERSVRDWNLWVSPLVNAPLAKPAPDVDYWTPFVGLRETLVFGDDFRLAFIQRGGFDRPGFGTPDPAALFKNTEGSHASLVQPPNRFSTAFYKSVFGFETAPYGEAHDSGDEPPTQAALRLSGGQTFRVERTRAPECPSGLLQVYSPYFDGPDKRSASRAGSRNLGLYSVQADDVDALRAAALQSGAERVSGVHSDEFGHAAVCFDAPDGLQWLATRRVHAAG